MKKLTKKKLKKYYKFSFFNHLLIVKKIFYQCCLDKVIFISFIFSLIVLIIGICVRILTPIFFKALIENLTSKINLNTIIYSLFIYGLIWAVSHMIHAIEELLSHKFKERVTTILVIKIISKIYLLPFHYFANQKIGAITNLTKKIQNNIPLIIWTFIFYFFPLIIEIILVLIILFKLFPLNYILALVGIIVIFVMYTYFCTKIAIKIRNKYNFIDRETDAKIVNFIENYEMVKTFGLINYILKLCKESLAHREKAQVKSLIIVTLILLGQGMILSIGFIGLIYFLGVAVYKDEISVGNFILFHGYLIQFINPISILGFVLGDTKKAIIDIKEGINILFLKSDLSLNDKNKDIEKIPVQIEFKNVHFSYGAKKILNNVSFQICKNEIVTIIGETGSGKSSIIKLLLRLYEVDSGEILINGINIKKISHQSLYDIIGVVPQDTKLFNDSIKNNIYISNKVASSNDFDLSIKYSMLNKFINKLPKGLDTIIGEKGINISGGEKQRISIARFFLKNPKLCLLDEPTSSLDNSTMKDIQNNFRDYLNNRTALIISHNINEAKFLSNKIFVLKNSKVMPYNSIN